MQADTKKALDNITDCMAGDDGCIRYIKLMSFLNHFDKLAKEGDAGAKQILDVMHRFSRLINIANIKDTYD